MKTILPSVSLSFVLFFCFLAVVEAQQIPTEYGRWSSPRPVTQDALNVFNSVIDRDGVDGVKYAPTSYSIQLVNGKRYRFYCRATVAKAPIQGSAMITVFVPMGCKAELASIQDTTKSKTFSDTVDPKTKWLTEPLYPRTGPYLQAPRRTVRRL